MNLVYGAFAIVLSLAIIINIMFKRPKGKEGMRSVSLAWALVGIPYLMMFLYMMFMNTVVDYAIYAFQVTLVAGVLWQLRVLDHKNRVASIRMPIGIFAFVIAWTAMGSFVGMSKFTILMPSVVILAAMSMMLATYFFMRNDSEIQLKSIIGILYTFMTVIKLMYLINANDQEPIFFIGLFVLDFIIHQNAAVLIFLNAYYENLIYYSTQGKRFNDLMVNDKEPMCLLNQDGGILIMNDWMKRDIKERKIDVNNLQDLFKHYGPEGKQHWAVDALEGFKKSESCSFSLETPPELGVQRYFSCDVINDGSSTFNIFFRVRSYPVIGFWTGEGRRTTDQRKRIEPSKGLIQSFDRQVANTCDEERIGFIIVRLTNYPTIETKLGSELAGDYVSAVIDQLEQTKGVEAVSREREDTLVILTDTLTYESVQGTVDRMVEQLSELYRIGSIEISLTLNLGVAVYPDDGMSYGELNRRAHVALARNTSTENEDVQYYESGYKYLCNDREKLEGRLKSAIDEEELRVLYQPQVDAVSQELRGFEALLRWEKDGVAIASPNIFIPLAEDVGIIEAIGSWVLEEAIKKASLWQDEFGREFIISVNVSSRQLEQGGFIKGIEDLLSKYHFSSHNLELEVTETRLLRSSKKAFKTLKDLKSLGVKIALDDFGTGYSSLDYLRWLPFDVLKIDKSFIDHLNSDTIEKEIVHSVIGLVNKMNLETVAEGVENKEQLRSLQKSCCTYIQGYLLSKPLNEFEVRETLLTLDG